VSSPLHAFTSLHTRLRFIWRYLRGRTPWDSGIVPPEVVAWIAGHEAAGRPPERALDLGCGTGTTSLYLAARGWDVAGIDFAPNAIRRARRKAARASLSGRVAFHIADVTRLDFLPDDFAAGLAVDIGCLHAVDEPRRPAYAAHLARLTRPGADYLLYAFQPRVNSRGQRMGIDRAGVEALFGAVFELISYVPGIEATAPHPSAWYTLRRVAGS